MSFGSGPWVKALFFLDSASEALGIKPSNSPPTAALPSPTSSGLLQVLVARAGFWTGSFRTLRMEGLAEQEWRIFWSPEVRRLAWDGASQGQHIRR